MNGSTQSPTFGLVASGGGYRSFYTAGVLVWLRQHDIPIVHITSTSSGNNIVLDYLLWDWDGEELPPVLTQTIRLSFKDIFDVFSNFAGLQPVLMPNGSHLFTISKSRCRKSLLLDDPKRRELLKRHLSAVKWDIMTTNLTQRRSEMFSVNEILLEIDRSSLDRFMDVFIAGITTIPYFKAVKMDDQFYLEGGYIDNTPLRTLFEDPEVDEIIAMDFTDYDYHSALERAYLKASLVFLATSIDMNLLVSDIQWSLPNTSVLSQAVFINQLLEALDRPSMEIAGKTYYHKPLHILRPKNLESMTVSLKDARAQKEYFTIGQREVEQAFDALS
ncbi:MAG: patatin-like phospholipase family protein [Anaerolineae bacterium]|jgi:predicted acylesterase/phospholipase RssA